MSSGTPADTALQLREHGDEEFLPAVREAIALWADATTDASTPRRRDLLRDKSRAVDAFFTFSRKRPAEATAADVKAWQRELESRGLKPATVYYRLSRLSSFYSWALARTSLGRLLDDNPVRLARPKAPKAYGGESTKSLDDAQVRALVGVVRARAAVEGDLVGRRDYALLLFYLLTGMRRAEVIGLRGRDIRFSEDHLVVRSKVKGGDHVAREVRNPVVREALVEYLTASRRRSVLGRNLPLWTRHDPGCFAGGALSSRSFAENLKRYAREAGIESIHVHQLRHTYARLVAEHSGSLADTQDALGHRHLSTTRVYVQRIGVKRDKFGVVIAAALLGTDG